MNLYILYTLSFAFLLTDSGHTANFIGLLLFATAQDVNFPYKQTQQPIRPISFLGSASAWPFYTRWETNFHTWAAADKRNSVKMIILPSLACCLLMHKQTSLTVQEADLQASSCLTRHAFACYLLENRKGTQKSMLFYGKKNKKQAICIGLLSAKSKKLRAECILLQKQRHVISKYSRLTTGRYIVFFRI